MSQTVYWLIESKEFIGQIVIKHGSLNEEVKKYIGHFSYVVRPSKKMSRIWEDYAKERIKKSKENGI